MARKEIEQREVWFTDESIRCANELDALVSDIVSAFEARDAERMTRYADALHEYAHRVEPKDNPPDTQKDQPARPTLDEISELQNGDEVMISGAWFRVYAVGEWVNVDLGKPRDWVTFAKDELAAICQGIRRHGQ